MTFKNSLPRDLNESVQEKLDANVKIILKCLVQLEVKTDKYESRVLVFSACRLFIFLARSPTRLDHNFHYMDVQSLESKSPNQMCLTVHDKKYCFSVPDDRVSEIDVMIINFGVSIKSIFPSVPLNQIVRRIDVVPPSRINKLYEVCRLLESRDPGPCGGFAAQYTCMCDFHAVPLREEVAWDVDTIYALHKCQQLNLHDFDHLEPRDLLPIISALEHNTYFTSLRASHMKLSAEVLERIHHVLRRSASLEKLQLDNASLKADFVPKMMSALSANTNSVLSTIDLSHNSIEDKGVSHLASALAQWKNSLRQLHLASCSLTSRGVGQLCLAMSNNRTSVANLSSLQLSGNSLRDDCSTLYTFLAGPNSLQELMLASCELVPDLLFQALVKGCTAKLVHLDISGNAFAKKSKDLTATSKQFFSGAEALKHVNMSNCRMPTDALKYLLLGLASNQSLSDLHVDISNNSLGVLGATVLESCLHYVLCLRSLNLSDTGIDQAMPSVLASASRCTSLRSLSLANTLCQFKTKHVRAIVETLVLWLQEDECLLEVLNLSESKLKSELFPFLNVLGNNNSLVKLDISGNFIGDTGARLLAKAIQINSSLREIKLDKNAISLQGFSDIAYGLQSNSTLRCIPSPLSDLLLCMKTNPERSQVVWHRIEELLSANLQPFTRPTLNFSRCQLNLSMGDTRQMLDRLVNQIRTELAASPASTPLVPASTALVAASSSPSTAVIATGTGESCADESQQQINAFFSETDGSKQLIDKVQELVMKDTDEIVEKHLERQASDLHAHFAQHVESLVDTVLDQAELLCPQTVTASVRCQLRQQCADRVASSRHSSKELLMKRLAPQLSVQLGRLQLDAARQVLDRVVDDTVACVTSLHRSLSTDSTVRSVSTPDKLSRHSSFEYASQSAPRSSPATPHSNKRLMQQLKRVRPTPSSVDLKKEDSAEGLSAEFKAKMVSNLRSAPSSTTVEEQRAGSDVQSEVKLKHLGHSRPRRAKSRAPSRAALTAEPGSNADVGQFFNVGGIRDVVTSSATPLASPDIDDTSTKVSLRKGFSSVFSKLSADRSSKNRSDRHKPAKPCPGNSRNPQGAAVGDESFLNHLLTPSSSMHATASPPASTCDAGGDAGARAVPSSPRMLPVAETSKQEGSARQTGHRGPNQPSDDERTLNHDSKSDTSVDISDAPASSPLIHKSSLPKSANRLLPSDARPPSKPAASSTELSTNKNAEDTESTVDESSEATASSGNVRKMAALLAKSSVGDNAAGQRYSHEGVRRSRRLTTSELQLLEEGLADGPRSLPSIYVAVERRSCSPHKPSKVVDEEDDSWSADGNVSGSSVPLCNRDVVDV